VSTDTIERGKRLGYLVRVAPGNVIAVSTVTGGTRKELLREFTTRKEYDNWVVEEEVKRGIKQPNTR
jgi:hypothetical protein